MSSVKSNVFIFWFLLVLLLVVHSNTFSGNPSVNKSTEINFYRDIQPIIYSKCSSCHFKGSVAPFPLITYEDVNEWASMIKVVVQNKSMPPWKPDPHYNTFKGERVLSEGQIDSILKWIDKGLKKGDAKDGHEFQNVKKEILSDTTLLLEVNAPFHHPGDGKDRYMNFYLPVKFQTDYWIKGVKVFPGNRKIVHHAWLFANLNNLSGSLTASQKQFGFEGSFGKLPNSLPIVGYLPGMDEIDFGKDYGKKIINGTQLFLQIHYFGSTIPADDQTKVLLYLDKKPVKHELNFAYILEGQIENGPLKLKANEVKLFKGSYSIQENMNLFSIIPHMHYRGRSIKVWANKPGSLVEIPLIYIPDWNFDQQSIYSFKEQIFLPKGSVIHYTALFDNTEKNMHNPVIPPVDVFEGESSLNEMLQIVIEYYTP